MNNPMNSNWQNAQPFGSYTQGVKFVTSLDEALMRANLRGSDDVYFHQDRPVFYRIKVDYDGRKTWSEFEYNVPARNNPTTQPNNSEYSQLLSRIERLEKLLQPVQHTEENANAQSNG